MTSSPTANIYVGMKLKRWADKQGLNQHEAAARLRISESFLSEYLHGKKSFGADNALRISKITGISIMDLLFPEITKREIVKEG